MTPKERVNAAIRHREPDRVPRDFSAEPAIWSKLLQTLQTNDREAVLRRFEIDCRVMSYDAEIFCRHPNDENFGTHSDTKAWKREIAPDVFVDIWGAKRNRVKNDWGEYEELCEYPLANAQSPDDLQQFHWPSPDWWDFSEVARVADEIGHCGYYHLRYRVGSIFETAWSLRGFDRFLMDLVLNPEIAQYMMERILEVHLENLRQVMSLAGNAIDMVYTYDDVAHQNGLLISPALWRKTIRPFQLRLFEKAKEYGKSIMLHCCGAVRPLLPEWIDMGLDVINPVQPLAVNMNFSELKEEFGNRLSFHGGIDIQELLPKGTPQEVSETVGVTCQILGQQGGYILAPAHHIQADTPLENIFALYDGAPA